MIFLFTRRFIQRIYEGLTTPRVATAALSLLINKTIHTKVTGLLKNLNLLLSEPIVDGAITQHVKPHFLELCENNHWVHDSHEMVEPEIQYSPRPRLSVCFPPLTKKQIRSIVFTQSVLECEDYNLIFIHQKLEDFARIASTDLPQLREIGFYMPFERSTENETYADRAPKTMCSLLENETIDTIRFLFDLRLSPGYNLLSNPYLAGTLIPNKDSESVVGGTPKDVKFFRQENPSLLLVREPEGDTVEAQRRLAEIEYGITNAETVFTLRRVEGVA